MADYKNTPVNCACAISAYLEDSGGSHDMGVDGSTTPVDFSYVPPAGKALHIGNVALYLEDLTSFSDETFAAQPALTNGIAVIIDGVEVAVFKTTLDVLLFMHDVKGTKALGKTERQFVAVWSANVGTIGKPLEIRESITFRVQDNLSDPNLKLYVSLHGFLKTI